MKPKAKLNENEKNASIADYNISNNSFREYEDLDLSRMNISQGIKIKGEIKGGELGYSVRGAGDFNNDGYSDVIIGAPSSSSNDKENPRISYLLFGSNSGLVNIDLLSLSSNQGFKIMGEEFRDKSGFSVSGAGDVNGDGFDDIIIGSPDAGSNGKSYIIFGKNSGFTDIDLSNLTPNQGFIVFGEDGGHSGFSVSGAGDVNGDGFDDIIIGDPYAVGLKGASYIIFGKSSGFADIHLNSLELDQGFKIYGEKNSDYSGRSVSGAGDVNGDGFDDILIGARWSDTGKSYVIFGKAKQTNDINLQNLDSSVGFRLLGAQNKDHTGFSVSGAGDINGDGYADIIVGAPDADPNAKSSAGTSYVIFGKATGFNDVDFLSMNESQGFRIFGAANGDSLGHSVSGAGDINGDGYADIIIGSPGADPNAKSSAGTSYVIFGKANGFIDLDLFSITKDQGYKILGEIPGSQSGFSVSGAGDVNGDGCPDIIIGAPYANLNSKKDAGAIYIVYNPGGPCNVTSLSKQPSLIPTASPSIEPSFAPTALPTASPTIEPSVAPTVSPSALPSAAPTAAPTDSPSVEPTVAPTADPSSPPSASPSAAPSAVPTASPSASPNMVPTVVPTVSPTQPTHPLVSAQITVLINLNAKEYMSDYVKLELALDNNNYCTIFENGLNDGKFANINYEFTCKEKFKLRALEGDSSENKIVDSFKLINSAEETCLINSAFNKTISLKGQGREYLINYQLTLKDHPNETDIECNKPSNPESKIWFRSDICKKGLLLKPPINTDTNNDGKEDWICEYTNGTIEICYSDGGTELTCKSLMIGENGD